MKFIRLLKANNKSRFIKSNNADEYELDDIIREQCWDIINMIPNNDTQEIGNELDKLLQNNKISQEHYDYIMDRWDYFFDEEE